MRTYQRSVDAFDEAAAIHLGVNRTDMRCLDVLLELGYVERSPDAADRRRIEVRPTARSLAMARKLWGPLAEEGGRALARYSKAELELLIDVLGETQAVQEAHTKKLRGMLPRRRRSSATLS